MNVAIRKPMTLAEFLAWEERQELATNSTVCAWSPWRAERGARRPYQRNLGCRVAFAGFGASRAISLEAT